MSKWNIKLDNMISGKRTSYESTKKMMVEHEERNIIQA